MKTPAEWAATINGREYGCEVNPGESALAKADGIVICYGESDDLLEFDGAIYDEVGAWKGAVARITPKATVYDEDDESREYNAKQVAAMPTVQAVWCPKNDNGEIYTSWEIRTEIPHEKFNIMEDGELFCAGVVFHVSHVAGARP